MAIDEGKELDKRFGMGFGTTFLGRLSGIIANAIRNQPTEIRTEMDVVARYEDLFLFSFPNTDFGEARSPVKRVFEMTRQEAAVAAGDEEF